MAESDFERMEEQSMLDRDFPPLEKTMTIYEPPNHSEAPLVMFQSFYTTSGKQKNITIRANSVRHFEEVDAELDAMAARLGWSDLPPGYTSTPLSAPVASSGGKSEPEYVDIPNSDPHKGPLKLEVQTVEMKKAANNNPYLKVGVSHPEMKWPVPAWFDTFKDKPEVVTNCYFGVVMPKDKIPASIKYALLEKVPNKKKGGALEWSVVGFSA